MSFKKPLSMVDAMHQKFGITPDPSIPPELASFRAQAMREEIQEMMEAWAADDQVSILDALVDLQVFLLGTVHVFGIPHWNFFEAFSRVMAANMGKELAVTGDRSKRKYHLDLVKPEGWEPPDLTDLKWTDQMS